MRQSLHHSVRNFALHLPCLGVRLFGSLQKIFCKIAFGLHLLHVWILFLRQDISFDLTATGHLAQLCRMVAIFFRRRRTVLLA